MPPTFSEEAKGLVNRALDTIPALAWRAMMPRTEIALCYHMVSHEAVPHVRPLFPYKNPAQFASDLEFLAGSDAFLSFDDGAAECRTIVAPLLSRYGQRATFFINTDLIDNKVLSYRHKLALGIDRLESASFGAWRASFDGGTAGTGKTGNGSPAGGVPPGFADPARAITSGSLDEPAVLRRRVADLLGVPQPAELVALRRAILSIRADRAARADALLTVLGIDAQEYLTKRRPYLTWVQVKELVEDGHVIGAHGLDHREFQGMPPAEIERQMVESCNAVRALTKQEKVPFAVPFTLDGLDRALLADIVRRNPQVGRIYGTSRFMPEPAGFLNRLVVDKPPMSRSLRPLNRTRLPFKIRAALRERAAALARRLVRRATGGSPAAA